MQAATGGIKAAFDGVKAKLTQGVQALKNSAGKLNTTFTGLSGGAGSNTAGSGKAGADEWEKLERKARQVSKSIEDQWVQTTKTEMEQLELWRSQQLAHDHDHGHTHDTAQRIDTGHGVVTLEIFETGGALPAVYAIHVR